ncbi:MAG: TVP38/TMEM64 family protein [Pseudomonadota bacterium]|nr:TVP38/TMEM64 family protein [Pseudomonadota bacterium]
MLDLKAKGIPWNLIIPAVVVVTIFAAWFLLPLKQWLQSFTDWIEGLGVWGGLLFAAVYVIGTVVLAPGSLFTIAAGLVFGLGWGFPIVMVGATAGAALAFLIARYVVREKIKDTLEKRPRFKAVDKAVTEDGWKVVLLLRLSPLVPFNLQNYFFGITNIDFWHYVFATAVGIVPGVLLYLYLGAIGGALTGGGGEWGTPQWIFFGGGLIATIVVAVLVTKKAKAKLKEAGVAEDSGQKDRTQPSKKQSY